MKKNKKLHIKFLIFFVAIYVTIVLVNQQKILNNYSKNSKELSSQIKEQTEYKEKLAETKKNVNSLDYIEEVAREKLDMYLPNERVYADKGM